MRDVALVLGIVAGRDPADPTTRDEPVPDYPLSGYEDLEDVRIGIPTRYFWDGVDGQIARACRAGLARLVDMGAELVDVDPPACTDEVMALPGAYGLTVSAEAAHYHRHWLETCPERYSGIVLDRLRQAEQVSGADYLEGLRLSALWDRAWRRTFAEHRLDAVASPTIAQPPRVLPASSPGKGPSLHLTKAWSINGFPSLSVPVGLDDRGLPVGLMLAALPEQEEDLVGIGVSLDEDVQLFRRAPPL